MREWIVRVMLVPPEPHVPEGSPDSVRVFRAGANYYRLRLIAWAAANAAILAGLLGAAVVFANAMPRMPGWGQTAARLTVWLSFTLFAATLPVTYLHQRLNYELRWYIVTDRSLRIRGGIVFLQEMTMMFANIQDIRVTAGPLQNLLGLADVEVHAAGGSAGPHGTSTGHVARFEAVDNANAIRDLMVERLRKYKDSGLGEHAAPAGALHEAQAMLEEARSLRSSLAAGAGAA